MRHSRLIATCALTGALTACGTVPHADTLLFGTDTKLALDVSMSPEAGGTPQVTVGYKRREFVVMPLVVNGNDSRVIQGDAAKVNEPKYLGKSDTSEEDTYSVLASFGADFEGGAQTGAAKAGGGLAQYFATGMAARILARQGGADLVNTGRAERIPNDVKQLAAGIIAKQITDLDKVVGFVESNGTVSGCAMDRLLENTSVAQIPGKKAQFERYKGSDIEAFRQFIQNGPGKTNLGELADKLKGKSKC